MGRLIGTPGSEIPIRPPRDLLRDVDARADLHRAPVHRDVDGDGTLESLVLDPALDGEELTRLVSEATEAVVTTSGSSSTRDEG
jgi:hypothetical protein